MSHCSSTLSAGTCCAEGVVQHALAHRGDGLGDVVGLEQLVALLVDHLALVVGDVVVLEQLLADVEVALLDLALRGLERARHQRMLDRLALGHLQPHHDGVEALAGEDAQQRIFERQVEARRARVALAAGAAAQLVVDAPRFVALGADDVQAAGGDHRSCRACHSPRSWRCARSARVRQLALGAQGVDLLLDVAAEHDVGAAAGHVGGDGDHAGPAGLGDDLASRACCLALSTWCGSFSL
jgi:hypothetical protein